MVTESTTRMSTEEKTWVFIVLGLVFALGWAVSNALRTDPPRDHHLVVQMQDKLASLDTRSRTERTLLRAEIAAGNAPTQSFAILGDGIAGVAAAVNLTNSQVRVFGSRSFWADLHGVGEVWQTGDSLTKPFLDAGLKSPKSFDSGPLDSRNLWLAVEHSRLDGLGQPHVRYLHSNCAFDLQLVVPGSGPSRWRATNCAGDQEDIVGPVIVSTGTSDARTISTLMAPAPVETHGPPVRVASPATRLELLRAGKLIPGDDYLAQSKPAAVKTLVVVGSGGNAFDVARHALSEHAAEVVVILGGIDGRLKTAAFEKLKEKFGDQICNSQDPARSIAFERGAVQLNDSGSVDCETLNGDNLTGRSVDLLVESLGRVSGDLPNVLRAVRTTDPANFAATPVLDLNTGALIAVRLDFENDAPPLLVTGAAADLSDAFFTEGPTRDKFRKAKDLLMDEINPGRKANKSAPQENPPVGFAAAAFMGSHLARQCFPKQPPSGAPVFDDKACY